MTGPDDISPILGRFGWDGAFGTHWFTDPAKELVAILMTQRALDDAGPANDFWKAAYQAMVD